MARAYSMDLRERAVAAARRGDRTRAEVAQQFDISEGTLYGWLRRWKTEGTLEPLPRGGGRQPSLDEAGIQQLREIVEEQNDRTLEEYLVLVEERTGVRMSTSALDRALQKLRLPRKKRRSAPANKSARM
jgi:transposase